MSDRGLDIAHMFEEAELGKRIQQHRMNKGLTLQELAEKTGFTKGYLSKIEKEL